MTIISGTNVATAIPTYVADARNEQVLATKWAASNGQTKSDIAYFKLHAPKLKTVDALMKDYRSLNIVLSAYNVPDLISYPGLVRQLLTQDPSSTASTAQKIGNPAYLRFAKAFGQFKTNPLGTVSGVSTVVTSYVTNKFEAAQNTRTPGLQNSLAFKRLAPQITSISQLMSNVPALKVAVAMTGVDFTTYGNMNYDDQVKLLTKKIKIADFKDPKKVDKMAEQYLVQAIQDPVAWGAIPQAGNTVLSLFGGAGDTSVLSLFGGSGTGTSILSLFA